MYIFILDKAVKETLNESMKLVIDRELAQLVSPAGLESVERFNESFLKAQPNNYERVIEACKIIYDLDPEKNAKKALDLLTNIKNKAYSISLKVNNY